MESMLQMQIADQGKNKCDYCQNRSTCRDEVMKNRPRDICPGFIPDWRKIK